MIFLKDLNRDELEALILFNTFLIEETNKSFEEKEKLSKRMEFLIQTYEERYL